MLEHTHEAKKLYKSAAWRKCRAAYIVQVHGLCERCKEPGKIVHHKVHINSSNIHDPEITLNHMNLEYLCQACHNQEHHEKYSPVRQGVAFDKLGNLIRVGESDGTR